MRRPFYAALLAVMIPLTSFAMGFDSSSDPTFQDGVAKVKKERYAEAIEIFQAVVTAHPDDADSWNMLGFSFRQTRDFDNAWDAYERALAINPEHRGAHEYIGEWYLMQGDVVSAEAQLKKLTVLCPNGCVERDTLAQSIASALKNG